MDDTQPSTEHLRIADVLPIYLRIGLLSFGGPAAQIALMQSEIVQKRKWVDPDAFQRGLNVAMLLPGPEAHQLATWLGWRLHGTVGGLAAGLSFVLPGTALMILLAWIAATHGSTGWVAAIFYGVQPAVLVIVARAVWALSRRSMKSPRHWTIALCAFTGIWAIGLPFPLIIALAAIAGFMLPPRPGTDTPNLAPRSPWLAVRTLMIGTLLVSVVYLGARLLFGTDPFDGVATLFTSAAFVSFGGAYALLPYVADQAVETYRWLSPAQMLNGLAIAEATPGPLILVNVYAGYFAGEGVAEQVMTAALACFYTFTPSFMLILATAPYVDALQSLRWARQALAGVSAAVVGVIINLALYLAEAAIFASGWSSPDLLKVGLLAAFATLTVIRPLPMTSLVIIGAVSGLGLHALNLIPG